MLKSDLTIGQIVKFACNGRGRGGHYGVTAVVHEIRRTKATLIEAERSYRPGTIWEMPIEKLQCLPSTIGFMK
jgi:hypothetical protein